MMLILLTNNIVLASSALIDNHESDVEVVFNDGLDTNPADHCCHIQSHFHNVLTLNNFCFFHIKVMRLIPHSDAHHILLSYIPPIPPPKA